MLSEGRTNVHDDDRSGRPSLVTADLLDQANEKIRENRRFAFSPLKDILAAERFGSHDEVKTAVQHWVKTLAAVFFENGIQKLVPRYEKVSVWVAIM
jgi:hypothetical protein